MIAFLRLIRLPNLVIIAITLLFLHYFSGAHLASLELAIVVLGTLLIAAAGNIINDIFDLEIDRINKPDRLVVEQEISLQKAWFFYCGFNVVALLLAVYSGAFLLIAFFAGAIFLLFLYSYLLKTKVLMGNLIVALLCAWVVIEYWALVYVELTNYWSQMLFLYALFAFLTTLCRELVKDLEDQKGDAAMGAETLPIRYGESVAIIMSILPLLLLLGVLVYQGLTLMDMQAFGALIYLVLLLLLPIFWFLFKLRDAKGKTSTYFAALSRNLKIYMLLGLGLLCLL